MAKLTKFEKNSVEAETIKSVKARQKKIDKAGVVLVALWHEQGKELLELQSVLECSQRQLVEVTGLKRSALQAYMNIAQDPRLGEEDVIPKLANFTQKELVKLGQLDEDEFNEAVDTGKLPAHAASDEKPKKKKESEEITDVDPELTVWQSDLIGMIMYAPDYESAKTALQEYFAEDAVVEEDNKEEEEDDIPEDIKLLNQAVEETGFDTLEEQAEELGLKKGVLKTALEDGVMSKATVKKIKAYLE